MTSDPITGQLCLALTHHSKLVIRAILLHGSKIAAGTVDSWSDTDLILILDKDQALITVKIDHAIAALGRILAREIHQDTDKLVNRYVVETDQGIEQVDLSIYWLHYWMRSRNRPKIECELIYGSLPKGNTRHDIPDEPGQYPERSVDTTWFRYFQCVKKLMRGDNLIGSHLLMALIRENLVKEMIERDERKQSRIHRRGDNEPMHWLQKLSEIDINDRRQLLDSIQSLSQYYDDWLMARYPD